MYRSTLILALFLNQVKRMPNNEGIDLGIYLEHRCHRSESAVRFEASRKNVQQPIYLVPSRRMTKPADKRADIGLLRIVDTRNRVVVDGTVQMLLRVKQERSQRRLVVRHLGSRDRGKRTTTAPGAPLAPLSEAHGHAFERLSRIYSGQQRVRFHSFHVIGAHGWFRADRCSA